MQGTLYEGLVVVVCVVAAVSGSSDVLVQLLDSGYLLDTPNIRGAFPLHHTLRNGKVSLPSLYSRSLCIVLHSTSNSNTLDVA